CPLDLGFDSFGDHLQLQGAAQAENRLAHDFCVRAGAQIVDDAFVDFHAVEGQRLQVADVRGATAEVVQGQLKTECLEPVQRIAEQARVRHDRRFGQLELDQGG